MWWLCLFSCSVVQGFQRYSRAVPNGEQGAWGHVGGVGGAARNAFGLSFARNNYGWSLGLCQGDSDGDGWTNGQELGDPSCEWEEDKVPFCSKAASNPGDSQSVPGSLVNGCASETKTDLWGPVPLEGLVCEHIVIGAGVAGMVASARLAADSNGVCVIAREAPATTTSAASSGTFFLPLEESDLPVQAAPLEFFGPERRSEFLAAAGAAQTFAEQQTGLPFRPTGALTYSGTPGERVLVPSKSSNECVFANMTEWLLGFQKDTVRYFKGRVTGWGPSPKEGKTDSGASFRATKGVIIAAGGYGASKTEPWKGAIADNDGLNLCVASALNNPVTRLEEGWFVERGNVSHHIYWFLWQDNAAVLGPTGKELPEYDPAAAYDARGRARLAAGNPQPVRLVYANTTPPCRAGAMLPAAEPAETEDRVCGASGAWWHGFPSRCFFCPTNSVCGAGLRTNQSVRGEELDLWVIDSNGGPVVGRCNEFTSVQGVYAVGNAAPPMLGHAYLAPGSTLGNALVSGWWAAECASRKRVVVQQADLPLWMLVHGGGMLFLWGLLFTLGFVASGKGAHPWIMASVTLISAGLAFLVLLKGDLHLTSGKVHPWFGLIVSVLSLFQPLWWWVVHSAAGHRWSGRILLVFVCFAVVTGSLWLAERDPALVMYVWWALVIAWSLKMRLIKRLFFNKK